MDVGCGSGILAISAAKLGLGPVIGIDHDIEAIRASRENASANGVDDCADFIAADLASGLVGRSAALVLANIQADVLARHARELVGAVPPGGCLVLGGILKTELRDVRARFSSVARGWAMNSRSLGEWTDLILVRDR